MRIPKLEKEIRVQLNEHEGDANAPVFCYEPLTLPEVAEQINKAAEEAKAASGMAFVTYGELFRARVKRIDNLEIGGEAYDPRRAEDFDSIDPMHVVEIGRKILNRARIQEQEAGK